MDPRRMLARAIKFEIGNFLTFGPTMLFRHVLRKDESGAVRVKTKHGLWYIRPSNSDLNVLRQIFRRRDYDTSIFAQHQRLTKQYDSILAKGRRPLIIDAGANIGAASVWFADLFPRADIVAIEPDPGNALLFRRNTEQRANVRLIEAAIGSTPGKVQIESPPDQGWGVQTLKAESGSIDIVLVHDIIREAGPLADLLLMKVDIEGFELDLFADNTEWIDDAFSLIIEIHDYQLPGQQSSRTLQKSLMNKGFEIIISGENLIFVR